MKVSWKQPTTSPFSIATSCRLLGSASIAAKARLVDGVDPPRLTLAAQSMSSASMATMAGRSLGDRVTDHQRRA